jgi:hypothetical protein
MLSELVGQFMKTSEGGALMQQLLSNGLSEQQATHAVTATAEGVTQATGAAGGGLDLGSLAGSLLGGGAAGGGLGALAGMLGGGAPAAPAAEGAAQNPLAGLIAPVAEFVAQKTGLAPAMAQMVVSAALPKLMALITGGAATPGAAPSVGGLVSSLFG